ncbi:MAG: hypothetical protein CMB80_15675 [Flammeovirgaceae bacterium]|nr:hypothetical protein [Flammeovirgaceae bacterium]MBE61376.1 hypothetical protein [Flammeovirgaceae bacterium]HCX22717.1 hypothetical protein [Cytophagales bacterium]
MRFTLLLSLVFLCVITLAQVKDIEVFHLAQEDGTLQIIARNNSSTLQSVQIEATLTGMESDIELPVVVVVGAEREVVAFTLSPIENTYSYNTRFSYIKGDITAEHDDVTVYQLPYKSGESYTIDQGYNESPTHMNQHALDFHMDEGTEICAIRDGVVFEVVDEYDKGCSSQECSKFNNYVLIQHADGSIADYSHLQQNGALVKVGDVIKTGEVIAKSGSTGFASGPHLHLEVYVMRLTGQKSIEAKYNIGNGVGIPQSGKSYRQN